MDDKKIGIAVNISTIICGLTVIFLIGFTMALHQMDKGIKKSAKENSGEYKCEELIHWTDEVCKGESDCVIEIKDNDDFTYKNALYHRDCFVNNGYNITIEVDPVLLHHTRDLSDLERLRQEQAIIRIRSGVREK